MSQEMRLVLWLSVLALFCGCPFSLAQSGGMQNDQNKAGNQSVSVTGCLKQGHESGGYYLTTKDGKIYELSGKSDFSKHVGHTVTVAGHETMMSKADEAKLEAHEKMEAGDKPYADLQVTSFKHVSENCAQ